MAKTLWMVGYSGAGKTTLAEHMKTVRSDLVVLDGDVLREGLSNDLDFTSTSRIEHSRRVAHVARILNKQGLNVVVAMVTPMAMMRSLAKIIIGEPSFIEVSITTPLEVCIERDPKAIYKASAAKEVKYLPGIDFVFERPTCPDVELDMSVLSLDKAASILNTMLDADTL